MTPSRRTGLVLVAAVGALVVLTAMSIGMATATDPRATMCPDGKQLTSFQLPAANRIWDRIPKMGVNPELRNTEPVLVIVYDGKVDIMAALAPIDADQDSSARTQEAAYDGVACVVVGGQPIVYADVDLAGLVK